MENAYLLNYCDTGQKCWNTDLSVLDRLTTVTIMLTEFIFSAMAKHHRLEISVKGNKWNCCITYVCETSIL